VSTKKSVGAADVIALLLVVPAYLLYGGVLAILWRWFVVSAFHVAPLSVAQAIGVSLVVSIVVPGPRDERSAIELLAASVGKALVVLAIGWVVHLWVAP
jgi:hypothetical protein